MASKELIDAIRTGTAEQIAEAIYQRFAGDIRDDQSQEIAQAIVAARDKPEDVVVVWLPWDASGIHFGGVSNTEKNARERCFQYGISQKNICRVTITREPTE